MVQFGPADYSMSIGLAGQWDHPEVVEAERRMIKTALGLGIAPRVEISRPEQAKPYLDLGVRHFCMGWDVEILFDWFKREGESHAQDPGGPVAMRASFYEGARRFRTGTAPEPKAGAGEAVLKVKRVGICGTDLHIFQGHLDQRVPKGGIIGHETFAEVAEAPPRQRLRQG